MTDRFIVAAINNTSIGRAGKWVRIFRRGGPGHMDRAPPFSPDENRPEEARSRKPTRLGCETRLQCPGVMRWAPDVPAAMIQAPPNLPLSGNPLEASVAPGIAIVVWIRALA